MLIWLEVDKNYAGCMGFVNSTVESHLFETVINAVVDYYADAHIWPLTFETNM